MPLYNDRDAYIGVFFFCYLVLTGLIGCIPSAVSFDAAWFVLIVWVALIPLVIDVNDTVVGSKRTGNDIMHAHWIDALTPDLPTALPRRVRRLKGINRGPIWTCTQLVLGVLFTALGIAYYDTRDRRVMIVLGVMWILEIGVRWALELTYNYYWKVEKSHPLVGEILSDSILTKWCKRNLGWPRDSTNTDQELGNWHSSE
jgi:hypothetical protein